jgi:hypothetical protein
MDSGTGWCYLFVLEKDADLMEVFVIIDIASEWPSWVIGAGPFLLWVAMVAAIVLLTGRAHPGR